MFRAVIKFFTIPVLIILSFYLYILYDSNRQQKVMSQCDQLIPLIESYNQKNNGLPDKTALIALAGWDNVQSCHYSTRNNVFRMTAPGTTFNFSIYTQVT